MDKSPKPEKTKAYRYLLTLAIAVGILAVAEVVYDYHNVVKQPGPTSNPTASSATASPPGTLHFQAQGHVHDPELVKVFQYNSNPPTSGPHDEVYPPGFVNVRPIQKAAMIHMLEHGNIVIVYNTLPTAELQQLVTWVNARNHGAANSKLKSDAEAGKLVFLSPWPSIPKGSIDALAWTRLYSLNKLNTKDLDAFVKAWQHNLSNMQQ